MNTRALLTAAFLSLGLGSAVAQDAPAEPAEAAGGPVTYALGGTLIVQVNKDPDTLAAGLSHNHAVKATGWTGSMSWDPANPSACAVSVNVPVQKLQPDAPASRKFIGLPADEIDAVSEGQAEDIKKNFLADDQLDAASHPNISFKSSSCEVSGSTINIKGNLTVKGKTKAVTIPLKGFSSDAAGFKSGKSTFSVKGSEFGVEPFSAMFGQLKNADKWTFHYSLSGKAK